MIERQYRDAKTSTTVRHHHGHARTTGGTGQDLSAADAQRGFHVQVGRGWSGTPASTSTALALSTAIPTMQVSRRASPGPPIRHKHASGACSLRASALIEAVVRTGRRCPSRSGDDRHRPPDRALLLSPRCERPSPGPLRAAREDDGSDGFALPETTARAGNAAVPRAPPKRRDAGSGRSARPEDFRSTVREGGGSGLSCSLIEASESRLLLESESRSRLGNMVAVSPVVRLALAVAASRVDVRLAWLERPADA
jgi:hypothetical protein